MIVFATAFKNFMGHQLLHTTYLLFPGCKGQSQLFAHIIFPAELKFDRKYFCREKIGEIVLHMLLHKVHMNFSLNHCSVYKREYDTSQVPLSFCSGQRAYFLQKHLISLL